MTKRVWARTIEAMGTSFIRTCSAKIFYWCARAFQLQLFLTLFSLPILVAWGLPLSVASPLGNFVFNPFLTIFLMLASLMFFAQLLHIPYGSCAYLLNHLTTAWVTLMNYGDAHWLVGIVRLPLPILIGVGISPLCIVAYRHTQSLLRSTLCFLLILISVYGYAHFTHQRTLISTIPCARGNLTLISTPNSTILIDPGYLGSMMSAASWTRYTLIPHLISTTGTTHIHHMFMLQPMGLGFEAAEQLCALLCIDNLYMPYWNGSMKRSHVARYGSLRQTLAATHTNLVRTGTAERIIKLADNQAVTLRPQTKQIRTGDMTFTAQELHTQIDNENVTIYSAKYTQPKVKSSATKQQSPTKTYSESLS